MQAWQIQVYFLELIWSQELKLGPSCSEYVRSTSGSGIEGVCVSLC